MLDAPGFSEASDSFAYKILPEKLIHNQLLNRNAACGLNAQLENCTE